MLSHIAEVLTRFSIVGNGSKRYFYVGISSLLTRRFVLGTIPTMLGMDVSVISKVRSVQ